MMQGDIENKIYRILNNVEFSDNDKILKILSFPPSLYTSPIGFVSILDIIKEGNRRFIGEYQKNILGFLKDYLTNSSDLIEKKLLLNDKFVEILTKYYSYNNSESLSDEFLKLISSPIFQTKVRSDFDTVAKYGSENSSQPPSPYSSQNSTPTTTPPPSPPPPPPPPPRPSTPPPESPPAPTASDGRPLLHLPIRTGVNGPVDESITVIDSQEVSQKLDNTDAMIHGCEIKEGSLPMPTRLDPVDEGLYLLPQRLDSKDESPSQQNIYSTSASVVLSGQNQGDDANLALQNSTASWRNNFVLPRRLGPEDYSNVSSAMPNGAPVVPLNTDYSASSSDAGSVLSSNSDQGKPDQDESGEKKTRCFGCLFSRVPLRITRCLHEIKMSGILKFISASCLGSSTKTRVRPGPSTP